jgi:hypothetical protein
MENVSWLETSEEIAGLKILFSDVSKNVAPPAVMLLLRTGEERTLLASSLLSRPLQEQEDCVLSAILATAALTQLLSSWTGSVLRITAVQPRMLITFLMCCEMITKVWSGLALDALANSSRKRSKPWSRNN